MASRRTVRLRLGSPLALLSAASLLTVLLSAIPGRPAAVHAADNPVVIENQQPGSGGWELGSRVANDTSRQIKGYASATSVAQGGSLTLYITVNPAQTYSIDVYRVGWYNGWGGRLRLHAGPLTGISQPACPTDATTGLIACSWTPGYTLSIPSDWTSGIYLAVLTNAAGYQNDVAFVVRDGRPAPFLYQSGMNTWQAYNDYPNDGATGKSLYEYNSYGAPTVSGTARAVKVSFDRPYADDGSGLFLSWEIQLVRWLERSGYDVTYSTDVDTHTNGSALLNHKAFFSTGHDEYWSNQMYNAAQAARDAGVNLAFFGANAVYWQVRFESSGTGVANRVMVCYKDSSIDPIQGGTTTVRWRDAPVNRPEQVLMGVMFTSETQGLNNVGYVVTNSTNWAYAGTGFVDGNVVPGIVGYETDRYMSNYPAPSTTNWTLLSRSPYTDVNGQADYANSSIYQAPSGAWVFATGTMSWSWALDNYATGIQPNARIQQTTANVLNAFLPSPSPTPTPTPSPSPSAPVVHDLRLTAPTTATAGQAFSVSVMAEDDQGNPVTSYSGTIHFSSSDTSTGVRLPPDSTLTNGQGTFSATLVRAGPQTLTVSDAANNLSTTANLAVSAAPANRLTLSGPAAVTAGNGFSFGVTAQDPYGNTDSSYAGTVHFTSSDSGAGVSLPSNSTLTNGQASFNATLVTAGTQTITGTDTLRPLISGTLSVGVTAATTTSITLLIPGTVQANQPFNVTATLYDRFGNVATGYRGTVHFTSSDLAASLPADYTFTASDAGRHVFSVTLVTPPSQTLTLTDTANPSLTTTTRPINVILMPPGL